MKKKVSKIQNIERKLNRYNHIMEFIRTLFQIAVLEIQIIILIKLFE